MDIFKVIFILGLAGILSAGCQHKRDLGPDSYYSLTDPNGNLVPRQETCEKDPKNVWLNDRCQEKGKACDVGLAWNGERCVLQSDAKNFFRYCKEGMNPEAQTLMDLLFAKVDTHECQPAWEALRRVLTFAAPEKTLTDISPLRGLTNLISLDLSKNAITDISPLASCVSLRSLDLHDNQITDLAPLNSLKHLITLNVTGNPGSK